MTLGYSRQSRATLGFAEAVGKMSAHPEYREDSTIHILLDSLSFEHGFLLAFKGLRRAPLNDPECTDGVSVAERESESRQRGQ